MYLVEEKKTERRKKGEKIGLLTIITVGVSAPDMHSVHCWFYMIENPAQRLRRHWELVVWTITEQCSICVNHFACDIFNWFALVDCPMHKVSPPDKRVADMCSICAFYDWFILFVFCTLSFNRLHVFLLATWFCIGTFALLHTLHRLMHIFV